MRTEMVRDLIAHVLHGLVEDRRHERHAAAAARAGFRAGLDFTESFAGAVFHDAGDIPFGDVVTRADLRVICEICGVVVAFFGCAKDEIRWWDFERFAGLDHGDELDVVFRVADHHASKEVLAIESEEVFLVDGSEWIFVGESFDRRWWRSTSEGLDLFFAIDRAASLHSASMFAYGQVFWSVTISKEIAKTCNFNAEQLEFGAEVGPLECPRRVRFGLREVEGKHIGLLYTRSNQTESLVLPAGTFADGVDVRITGS